MADLERTLEKLEDDESTSRLPEQCVIRELCQQTLHLRRAAAEELLALDELEALEAAGAAEALNAEAAEAAETAAEAVEEGSLLESTLDSLRDCSLRESSFSSSAAGSALGGAAEDDSAMPQPKVAIRSISGDWQRSDRAKVCQEFSERAVSELRRRLVQTQLVVGHAQDAIVSLIHAAPATTRAGYLVNLPDLIGDKPQDRLWQDEWLRLKKEQYALSGQVGGLGTGTGLG